MVVAHTKAKTQVQRSAGSKDKSGNKRTDGQTDAANYFTFAANTIDN